MKALTLWQPLASAIVLGHKRVENRPWKPWAGVIGARIAIHAGKTYYQEGADFLRKHLSPEAFDHVVTHARAHAAAILGTVKVVRAVAYAEFNASISADPIHDDPMFFGPWGWVVEDPIALATPVPCRGALGLWTVPEGMVAA